MIDRPGVSEVIRVDFRAGRELSRVKTAAEYSGTVGEDEARPWRPAYFEQFGLGISDVARALIFDGLSPVISNGDWWAKDMSEFAVPQRKRFANVALLCEKPDQKADVADVALWLRLPQFDGKSAIHIILENEPRDMGVVYRASQGHVVG